MLDWNLEKITELINNRVEESLNLDYKAAASLKRDSQKISEISKDVSAFANSDGGTIIYGISENQGNRCWPGAIDPVNRREITKEWLEQIIHTRIHPKIDGIRIFPIEIKDSPDKVIFVVDIPQSNTVHQADDKKYYRRYNFMSSPMDDYEIRDILNRQKNPEIVLEFKIVEKNSKLKLKIYAYNKGPVLANYVNAFIDLNSKRMEPSKKIQFYAENTIRDVVDADISFDASMRPIRNPKYGPSRYAPILPMRRKLMLTEIIELDTEDRDAEIEWTVYADNAKMQKGKIKFIDIERE